MSHQSSQLRNCSKVIEKNIFSHLFLMLDWNLTKRPEKFVDLKVRHIPFFNDALVFGFSKSKGHQTGEYHVGPWRFYANPLRPYLCPVIALAQCIVYLPQTIKRNTLVFQGCFQYKRYYKLSFIFSIKNKKMIHSINSSNW